MRAAFYYPWYPEQWQVGHRHIPLLGEYDSGRPETMQAHIAQMQYARVYAALYSWWGRNSLTDQRFGAFLDACAAAGFKAAVYYELDQDGRSSYLFRVKPDLRHIRDRYFAHPAYLRVGGRPVVFVYNPLSDTKGAAKWVTARRDFSLYVNLADYPNWWTANVVDSWHGYRPALRGYAVRNPDGRLHAISVSAGFWSSAEPEPRLARNFAEWEAAVALMRAGAPEWQLVYWNEHGEGTAIEPSDARCEEYLCSDYLATLRAGG